MGYFSSSPELDESANKRMTPSRVAVSTDLPSVDRCTSKVPSNGQPRSSLTSWTRFPLALIGEAKPEWNPPSVSRREGADCKEAMGAIGVVFPERTKRSLFLLSDVSSLGGFGRDFGGWGKRPE